MTSDIDGDLFVRLSIPDECQPAFGRSGQEGRDRQYGQQHGDC
jgi:hypothetical protein